LFKRGLMAMATMVALFSGVGMVSAFEAHAINVTAHVENAVGLDQEVIAFGTVFPEEWRLNKFDVRISESFCAPSQTRHTQIFYEVWVVEKPDPDNLSGGDNTGVYPWLGDAMYLAVDTTVANPKAADFTPVGTGTPPILMNMINQNLDPPALSTTQSLNKADPFDEVDTIKMGLDVPVFEGFWNDKTDVDSKPSGLPEPTVVILKTDEDRYFPEGEDPAMNPIILGADIVIQVIGFGSPSSGGCPT